MIVLSKDVTDMLHVLDVIERDRNLKRILEALRRARNLKQNKNRINKKQL